MASTPPPYSRFQARFGRALVGLVLGVVLGWLAAQNFALAVPAAGSWIQGVQVLSVLTMAVVGGLAGWCRGPISRALGACLLGALCGALCGAVIGWTWGRLADLSDRKTVMPAGVLIGLIIGGLAGFGSALWSSSRR